MMKRIFLIGFMGCGKTTWGRKLAAEMDLSFIDLDKYIEERMLMTVPEIFAKLGQDEFRKLEQKYLKEVAQINDAVISTGGGAPCFFDNMEFMNENGLTIYMNLTRKRLVERLLKSKNKRPLVDGKSPEELSAYIKETLKLRNVYYKKAKFIMNPQNHTIESLAKAVSDML